MCGELLPVRVEREKGKFFVYNVTNCINAVDDDGSKWETLSSGHRQLIKPSFLSERLSELSIFKIPEDFGQTIYCLERSGDPEDGEFKALAEYNNLTGLAFKLIWSEKRRRRRRRQSRKVS